MHWSFSLLNDDIKVFILRGKQSKYWSQVLAKSVLGSVSGQYPVSIRAVSGARSTSGGGTQHQCRRALGPNILIDPHRACRHAMRFRGSAVILGLCILLTCMMVVCLMMITNSEPWAWSLRRNSLPLPALRAHGPLRDYGFLLPLDFCIDFCIDFGVDFGPYFGPKFVPFSMIFWTNFQAPFLEWLLMFFCHLFVPLMS